MKVVFRVDASLQIGTGHVMRCLTLAKVLKKNGANVGFICRKHKGHLIDKIRSSGFNVTELDKPVENQSDNKLIHSNWLGATQQQDAKECTNALQIIQPDWLIVDHYAIDEIWQLQLKGVYNKLMIIDDLADRKHQCDLLLDQNLFKSMSTRYQEKLPEKCIQLLGPKYALLQPNYADLHTQTKPRNFPLSHLLVFFGGVDQHNLTSLTLSALEKINIPFKSVDVVISRKSEHYRQIKNQVMRSSRINLHSDLPSLGLLMKKADLAIGAGGATSWERLCLGLPSLIITMAENQRPVNHDLHEMGLVEWIGDVETIKIEQISSAINEVLSRDDIRSWSELCMENCSGQGTTLVADTIFKI